MAKKFFFLPALPFGLQKLSLFLPSLFSPTITAAMLLKNALAKEKIIIFTSIQIHLL